MADRVRTMAVLGAMPPGTSAARRQVARSGSLSAASSPRISAPRLARLIGEPPVLRPMPYYRWISMQVAWLIQDGQLPVGSRLPSERSLATALNCGRVTVGTAFTELRDLGMLVTRQGSGSYTALPVERLPRLAGPLDPGDSRRELIDLSAAATPAGPRIGAAYAEAVTQLPKYLEGAGYHPLGLPELTEAIARWYSARGLPTAPAQIIVTGGALSALAIVASTLTGPGQRVVCESPTYCNGIAAMGSAGARLHPLPVPPSGLDGAGAAGQLATLRPALTMLIPDFHNPTGTVLSEDGRAELAEVFRGYGGQVVVDETLVDMALDDTPLPRPFAAHLKTAISVGSASKSYWGGLRIGWLRAPHAMIADLVNTRLRFDLGAPPLEQLVLARLMQDGPVADLAALRSQRDVLLSLLAERLPQWQVRRPAGGLSVWCELDGAQPGDRSVGPGAVELAALAEAHDVLLAPGPKFTVAGGSDRFVRLAFTQPESVLRTAVPLIAAAWTQARHGVRAGAPWPSLIA